jgi:hypothetical protein
MTQRLKSKVLLGYFNGLSPEKIAEEIDYPLSHVTRVINEINVDVRKQKELESESKLNQIACIEDELFRAIKNKDCHMKIKSLQYSYSTFCV